MKLLTLLFGGLISVSAFAMELGDAKAPTQAQLNLLLTGNTVQGEWDGRDFHDLVWLGSIGFDDA